jgi:cellulose synthase (UDP-forming)
MKQLSIKSETLQERLSRSTISKAALVFNVVLALLYFGLITFRFDRGNGWLYALLVAGEVFHVWQVLTYAYTVWNMGYKHRRDDSFTPDVDIFITVAGEPVDIIEETVRAAKAIDYPNFTVHVLNDGFVAKKDNWRDVVRLCQKLSVDCITRTIPGGAKAGNINHALSKTEAPFVVVFDADHVPHKDFLAKTMGYFADPKMGFVQSPQFYKNHDLNSVSRGAWDQQAIFFGAICRGKNRLNSAFMCGTNMVLRRTAVLQAGGMCETNIAEDFVTSVFIHEKGWKSVYVPEVLAEGLAPEDFMSYYKQQFRWARGSLEVIFRYNPLFRRGLSWAQKIQYLASASFYLSGLVVLIDAMLPIIFLFTGAAPLIISTMALTAIFLPYIFSVVYILEASTSSSFTFNALSFSYSAFPIHLQAIWAVITNKKSSFAVTSKRAVEGNFTNLVIPHLLYGIAAVVGIVVAIIREGFSPAIVTNVSWVLFNVVVFTPYIAAATGWWKKSETRYTRVPQAQPNFLHAPQPVMGSATTTAKSSSSHGLNS